MVFKIIQKKTVWVPLAIILIGYWSVPLPSPLFEPHASTVILDDKGQFLRVFLNRDEQWCIPSTDNFSPPENLKQAVLTFEDRYFYYHPGVNPVALLRALSQNLTAGRIVSGASTITMQLARLIRPKARSFGNKFLETLQALKIELHYSKEEILRLYLDHAPYGGNVIGYRAAALRYFGKHPRELTWGEAAVLAVLPNAPGLISPEMNPEQLLSKRNRLLKTLYDRRAMSEETYQLSLLEPIPAGSRPFQMLAPHASQYLKDRYGGVVSTTINAELQENIEILVRRHLRYLKQEDIRNGAILVAETASGKVRAYVGSQDFFDQNCEGQVDGVRAPRSSGSLLKPFLYGLCIDEGILLPQTLLKDIPTFYGAFSPSNANETFEGILSAKEALVRSLNVPAVRLLYSHGLYPFYLFLKEAGVSTLFRSAEDYGLPLILGGAEVTVWDMAALFRGLGNQGRFSPLILLADEAEKESIKGEGKDRETEAKSLISPMACYLTLNMLRELRRPGAEYYWEQYQHQWPLAWKTGTSYGHRDAWAVGVTPQWTIAVWVGNFTGEGNKNLAGARCAGPLLFDIFNYLPKDPRQAWFSKPAEAHLSLSQICSVTGFLGSGDCPTTTPVEIPRYMKPLRRCPYHRRIYVTTDEQYRVNSLCWEPGKYRAVQRLIFPADVVQYLRERGQMTGTLPPLHPDCPAEQEGAPLQILYPQENARLWVPRDFGGKMQRITLRVAHLEKNRLVYWYLNDHYLGSTRKRHEKAVELTKGWHILEVIDETGHRDRKRFFVDRRRF